MFLKTQIIIYTNSIKHYTTAHSLNAMPVTLNWQVVASHILQSTSQELTWLSPAPKNVFLTRDSPIKFFYSLKSSYETRVDKSLMQSNSYSEPNFTIRSSTPKKVTNGLFSVKTLQIILFVCYIIVGYSGIPKSYTEVPYIISKSQLTLQIFSIAWDIWPLSPRNSSVYISYISVYILTSCLKFCKGSTKFDTSLLEVTRLAVWSPPLSYVNLSESFWLISHSYLMNYLQR